MILRSARPEEAGALSDLVLRSKAPSGSIPGRMLPRMEIVL